MRFRDIEQHIGGGNYEVVVYLYSIERTLQEMEEDYGLDLQPDFQREHVWTEEQQIAFVEFFLSGGKTGRTLYFNCPVIESGKADGDLGEEFIIVDGLQRLTALRAFVNDKIKVFGQYYSEFEDRNEYGKKINLRFNVNDLKYKKDVLKWYIQFNSGGVVHTEEEINRVKRMLEELESEN